MENISVIRNKQIDELKVICEANKVNYASIERLLKAEKIKKLQKRNHYIQTSIDNEIENSLK